MTLVIFIILGLIAALVYNIVKHTIVDPNKQEAENKIRNTIEYENFIAPYKTIDEELKKLGQDKSQ